VGEAGGDAGPADATVIEAPEPAEETGEPVTLAHAAIVRSAATEVRGNDAVRPDLTLMPNLTLMPDLTS
jgi:hypothetical protein